MREYKNNSKQQTIRLEILLRNIKKYNRNNWLGQYKGN